MFAFRFTSPILRCVRGVLSSTISPREMASACCANSGAKQSHEAHGHVEEIGGVNTYKTGDGKSAIVIFTDIFGYSFVNAKKIADSFAHGSQTTVLIPDYFNGDPIDPKTPDIMGIFPAWLKKHPVTDAYAIVDKFLSTIKGHYQSIQVIGFCYGAKVVVYLITHPELSSTVKAAVVAHPSFLVQEEAKQIKRPILFLCAEKDFFFTDDLKQEFEKELTANGLGTFLIYPGTEHGFVMRPDGSEQVNQQRDKAVQDAIQYFNKNL